jgi:hypothetical protein
MPIDRGVIDQQLQALGEGSRWWEHREMRDLPAVMHEDEQILAISRGKVARALKRLRRSWLIVVTQKRLLCIRSTGSSDWRQLDVNGAQIARLSLRLGPFNGRVLVLASGRKYRLLLPRDDAYRVVDALSKLGSRASESLTRVTPTLMVRRVIDHVLALPVAALNPVADKPAPPVPSRQLVLEERLHALELEVEELRQQVSFLEELLRQQHEPSRIS